MKNRITLLILFALSTILCGSVNANTIVVSKATDAALRGAVANAAPGDTINFAPALFANGPAEIALTGAILIEKDLTIAGPESGSLAIKGGQKEIFVVGVPPQGCHVLLRNVKLWDGTAQGKDGESLCTGGGGGAGLGGAVYVNFAVLTCQNVVFEKNSAFGGNGGISGMPAKVNGGNGGDACSENLIYQTNAGEYVRGNNKGGLGGDVNTVNHLGSPGGYACGGGGGVGERFLMNNAAAGGAGGWAGGGGGGGGGGITFKSGGAGGEFGGIGGAGAFDNHGGGGGGAGLGGAIFVDSNGGLILENCVFRGNRAKGGMAGLRGTAGQGKGGAIFAKPNTTIKFYDVTFSDNIASDSSGNGFTYTKFSDTRDLYGTVTNVVVTTARDEDDGLSAGTGLSLREAIQVVDQGGEIRFSETILPCTVTVNPALGSLVISRNMQIAGPGVNRLTIDGNQKRIFFVKQGNLSVQNMELIKATTQGGHGASGNVASGGGAGLGGAVFINAGASFYGVNLIFDQCRALGGNPGESSLIINDGVFPSHSYTGGGGGMGGDGSSNGDGGTGWPLEGGVNSHPAAGLNGVDGQEGSGGSGVIPTSVYNCLLPGGNGGFGGGGGGGYTTSGGRGGFGGGAGAAIFSTIENERDTNYSLWLYPNEGGAFGGGSYYEYGGGGAGLGGAIFVRETGKLFLDQCQFTNNSVAGGSPSSRESRCIGQAKGGALFIMPNAIAQIRNCSFNGKSTANPGEIAGFAYNLSLDIPDIYGVLNELPDTGAGAFPPLDTTPSPTPDGGQPGEPTPTPTVTPTPYATPTPVIPPIVIPKAESSCYTFSGQTAEENKVTLQGAGFGAYPQAAVSFGAIPTDNAFEGATDGQGVIITAFPGEGVMIFGERVNTNNAAMIRCSVRTEGASAAITIATIGDKPDQFVATNSPADETYFAGQYQRLAVFYTPPSTGFQPVVQIVNTSKTETLIAYLDNMEVFPLNPAKYYSAAFLDNDTVDPPADKIVIPSSSESGVVDEGEPILPETITVALSPDSNTDVVISWSATSATRDLITVQRATDSNNEASWEDVSDPFFNDVDETFTDYSLLPNTVYFYRLSVYNELSGKNIYSIAYNVQTRAN